jgi:hypothetical protein
MKALGQVCANPANLPQNASPGSLPHPGLKPCLASSYLQLDESPIKELAPGTGKTRTGYVWVLNDPCPGGSVSYRWQNGRSRKDLDQALGKYAENWKGIFQSDRYSVYPSYQRDQSELIKLGSGMTHIRRGFTKALDAEDRDAARIVRLISDLYQIEEDLRQE